MNLTRLLIIDDDVKLCRLLGDYLNPLGYEVVACHSGREGLERAVDEDFAAVILDVMLPGMNGLDVLRELRRQSNVPVLMLTALGEEPDRIVGLEMGADDYIPKNFSTRELLARLRAVLRRSVVTAQLQEPARSDPSRGGRPVAGPGNSHGGTGRQAARIDARGVRSDSFAGADRGAGPHARTIAAGSGGAGFRILRPRH